MAGKSIGPAKQAQTAGATALPIGALKQGLVVLRKLDEGIKLRDPRKSMVGNHGRQKGRGAKPEVAFRSLMPTSEEGR
jgi:hypothetical protein